MDLNGDNDGDGHFRGVGVGRRLHCCVHDFASRASGASGVYIVPRRTKYQAYQAYVIVIARESDQVRRLFVCSSWLSSVCRR